MTVYAPGSTSVLRTISHGLKNPASLLFDPNGSLFVGSFGNNTVAEYAPGSQTAFRKIQKHVRHPVAIALDANRNLYVANEGPFTQTGKVISIHAPGRKGVRRLITTGVDGPIAIAFGP